MNGIDAEVREDKDKKKFFIESVKIFSLLLENLTNSKILNKERILSLRSDFDNIYTFIKNLGSISINFLDEKLKDFLKKYSEIPPEYIDERGDLISSQISSEEICDIINKILYYLDLCITKIEGNFITEGFLQEINSIYKFEDTSNEIINGFKSRLLSQIRLGDNDYIKIILPEIQLMDFAKFVRGTKLFGSKSYIDKARIFNQRTRLTMDLRSDKFGRIMINL